MKLFITQVLCYLGFCLWSMVKATETETFNKNGIFGSFKMLMNSESKAKLSIKKTNKVFPTVTLGDMAGKAIQEGVRDLAEKNRGDPTYPTIKLGSPPFWSGWIQYFKYSTDKGLKKPNSFFKNLQYNKQLKDNYTLKKEEFLAKDADGQYKYIPKNTYFYGTLFENTFNVASSKEVSIFCYFINN